MEQRDDAVIDGLGVYLTRNGSVVSIWNGPEDSGYEGRLEYVGELDGAEIFDAYCYTRWHQNGKLVRTFHNNDFDIVSKVPVPDNTSMAKMVELVLSTHAGPPSDVFSVLDGWPSCTALRSAACVSGATRAEALAALAEYRRITGANMGIAGFADIDMAEWNSNGQIGRARMRWLRLEQFRCRMLRSEYLQQR